MSGSEAGNSQSETSSRRGHDVFISHSREDKATADAVCAALEGAGIPCWIGPRDTQAGAYGRSIMEAIHSTRMLVLILSPSADRSPNVLTEVAEAFDSKIPLLPFRLSNFPASNEMRFYIRTQHWIDAFPGPAEQHIPAIVDRVKLGLRPTKLAPADERIVAPQAGTVPPASAAPRKRRGIVWAFTATAGALGIGITMSVTLIGSQGSDPARFAERESAERAERERMEREKVERERNEREKAQSAGGNVCDSTPQMARVMDLQDCYFIQRTLVLTLATAIDGAEPSSWSNPRSGRSGSIKVIKSSGVGGDTRCRDFEMTIEDMKQRWRASGRACYVKNDWIYNWTKFESQPKR